VKRVKLFGKKVLPFT